MTELQKFKKNNTSRRESIAKKLGYKNAQHYINSLTGDFPIGDVRKKGTQTELEMVEKLEKKYGEKVVNEFSTAFGFKKYLKLKNDKIKEDNDNFERLSPAGKRKYLATDIIAQIKAKNFIVIPGTYIDLNDADNCRLAEFYNLDTADQQLNKVFGKKEIMSCSVCALGSLAFAHILKTNHCTVEETMTSRSEILNRLDGIWTEKELDVIETAFEGRVISDEYGILQENDYDSEGENRILTDLGQACMDFYNKYPGKDNADERLIAICRNIIKNGEFKLNY